MHPATDQERIRVLEVTLWGVDGRNGMRSDLRAVRDQITALDAKVDEKFDALDAQNIRALTNRLARVDAWMLGIVTTLLIVGGGICAAILA